MASPASSTQITLSWTDNSVSPNTADSFFVQESTDNGMTWNQIATVLGTGYVVSGLTPNTAYEFRVQAHDSFGVSGFSNIASATSLPSLPHSINYGSGFTTANTTIGGGTNGGGLAFNGGTQADARSRRRHVDADDQCGQPGPVGLFHQPRPTHPMPGQQDIVSFSTTFTYNLASSGSGPADGVTFVIQNTGLTALGGGGGSLGYMGIAPVWPWP